MQKRPNEDRSAVSSFRQLLIHLNSRHVADPSHFSYTTLERLYSYFFWWCLISAFWLKHQSIKRHWGLMTTSLPLPDWRQKASFWSQKRTIWFDGYSLDQAIRLQDQPHTILGWASSYFLSCSLAATSTALNLPCYKCDRLVTGSFLQRRGVLSKAGGGRVKTSLFE